MKIAIGSDKAGFELKEKILPVLKEKGYEVKDLGLTDPDGYMSFFETSDNVAKALQRGEAERGILICGTGAGMCLNANRYEGIFAVSCESVYTARMCRIVNDANILTFGANVVGFGNACDMVNAFLTTEFTEGMPAERSEYLKGLKENYMKFLAEK